MPFTKYIDLQTINRLVSGIQNSALVSELEDVRSELLVGIDPGFVANLSSSGPPQIRIKLDLDRMNTVSHLLGDEVPLQYWLINAEERMRTNRQPDTPFFQQVLKDVTAQSQQIIAEAAGQAGDPNALSQEERIVHQDDMLSFEWLTGALTVGRSVARLTVNRYHNGRAIGPESFGTGWLIGSQHLITNHHVLDYLGEGQGVASDADLHLQATSAVVIFDYNNANLGGERAEVEKLCAWVTRLDNPGLDYAILKLKEPMTDRPAAILAPSGVEEMMEALKTKNQNRPPVNIIQHPGGRPKMLGIRNNQIYQLDDVELSYFTDTVSGSSGSPVCNDEWQVVALHRRWQKLYTKNVWFQGKATAWENRGTRIDCIINDLKENHPELWNEIGATVVG
ncbi:MAG: trypsin-like peptidase domain-containing protein [Chloroflexota bacterium]